MKNFKILLLLVLAVIGLNSCQEDDDLVFVAQEASGLTFNTSFLDNYVLNSSVGSNLAERFTWNDANYGVETNVSYYLQGATMEDFSDYVSTEVLGDDLYDLGNNLISQNANEIPVTVSQMLELADAAGLDADPTTVDMPNTGILYFRLMSALGDNSSLPSYSAVQALNIELQEQTAGGGGSGIEPASWGVVGSGYNNWGAFEDGTFYTTADAGIIVTYVTLVDGEIKFREDNAWDSNLGDTGADGTLEDGGDNIMVTAGDYKITFNTNDNTYTLDPFSWGVVGSGYNDWGATPDAKFTYDYVTDTFKVGVRLIDGEIKFRQNNAWDVNIGDTGADGTLDDGGDNLVVTAGHYSITIDLNENMYTLEAANLYGVVGSGYNDWGATQDFTFTPLSDDVWVAEVVALIDGEIKFRINDAWDSNFGDTGADGTLDDGGDNIMVTAGNYRIKLNIADGTYVLNAMQ